MKKIASIFMAVAMVLALSVPAFAGTVSGGTIVGSTVSGGTVEPSSPYSSDFKGEYQQTEIDIELPNNVSLVFNPYRLEYNASTHHSTESGDNVVLVDKLADQIFSAPVSIVSKSNIQLDVDMEFTVAAGANSEIEFAASEADYNALDPVSDAGQNVLLQMVYGIVKNANDDPSDCDDPKTITLYEDTTLTDLQGIEDEKDSGKQELTVTIPAGKSATQYFGYKFTGKAMTQTSAPGDDPNPYNSDDTIDVGIVFTFMPKANEDIQVQGGNFFYTLTTGTPNVASVRTSSPAAATDSDDITITLPTAINAKAASGTRTYTLPDELKYDVGGTATNGVEVSDDGKTLTLKKGLVVTKADVAKAANAKYVVTFPVQFKVTDGGASGSENTDNLDYVVRVIMNPLAPAS